MKHNRTMKPISERRRNRSRSHSKSRKSSKGRDRYYDDDDSRQDSHDRSISPKSERRRNRSRSHSKARKSRKNRDRCIYDDDDDSQQDTVWSRVAEDGDRHDLEAEGCVLRTRDSMFCCAGMGGDESTRTSRSSEILQLKKEIKEMKRMIKPSKSCGSKSQLMTRTKKPSSSAGSGSSRMNLMIEPASVSVVESKVMPDSRSNGIQLDVKRNDHHRSGKLVVLSENELKKVDTRDEEDKQRREKYLTELGRIPSYEHEQREQEEDSGMWRYLKCFDSDYVGACISWNNSQNVEKRPDNSDNVSDITTPYVPRVWKDPDFNTMNVVEMPPSLMVSSPRVVLKSQSKFDNQYSYASSHPTRGRIATARERLNAIKSKSPLRSSIKSPSSKAATSKNSSSQGLSNSSPKGAVFHFKSSDQKVKEKKVVDDDRTSMLYEV